MFGNKNANGITETAVRQALITWQEPELHHRGDAAARLTLQGDERIEAGGVDDQRLLADRRGPGRERQPDVGVVEVVGRADADVVDPLLGQVRQIYQRLTVYPKTHYVMTPETREQAMVSIRNELE